MHASYISSQTGEYDNLLIIPFTIENIRLIIQPALTSCCGFGNKLPANRISGGVLGHSVSRPNYTRSIVWTRPDYIYPLGHIIPPIQKKLSLLNVHVL